VTRGDMVAAEVERWDRTPFHPQQRARGYGVDCKGLPWGVAAELGFPEAQSRYANFITYDLTARNGLPHKLLLEGMAALFDRVEEIEPGDILLLKIGGLPAHIAIASRNEGRAWHAQLGPNAFVKEASLRSLLKMFPLHSIWRWRD
jgi:hypothetical protein